MADLALNDIVQQYNNCLIFYKGKPHKVKRCGETITLLDVTTQRAKQVEFKLKDFSAPPLRLGYLNVEDTATYIARMPIRMFSVGINVNNCKFHTQAGGEGLSNAVSTKIHEMECIEYGDMFFGHYPPFESALKQAIYSGGAVAFDKQFCVDYVKRIYYKGELVGYYDQKQKKIDFTKGKEYLSILLEDYREKDLRTFSQEAA